MSLNYVVDLARRNTDAIGFIPRPKLEKYEQAGQILTGYENDEPCGFLVYGNGYPLLRVYQACIQYDARRREHGFALVRDLETRAAHRGVEAISLWCASDLEASEFWRAAGFERVGTKLGGARRARSLSCWRKIMPAPAQPCLEVS